MKTKWTRFMDMHSGGGLKEEPYEYVYIEAPEDEAKVIFYNRFGHNPNRVSCTCCGSDYSITESDSLEEATAYNRGCAFAYFDHKGHEVAKANQVPGKIYLGRYVEYQDPERTHRKYTPLSEYKTQKEVLVIPASEIKSEERVGEVPEQGYVWRD